MSVEQIQALADGLATRLGRAVLVDDRDQLQRRQADQERPGWLRVGHGERRQQTRPLPGRQPLGQGQDRQEQLMQPREWEPGLGLDAGRRQDPGAGIRRQPGQRMAGRRYSERRNRESSRVNELSQAASGSPHMSSRDGSWRSSQQTD